MALAVTVRPIRSSRFVRLCAEKTVWRVSPVPLRPTTSPYPMSWLSRTPSSEMSSFRRVGAAAKQVAALWQRITAISARFIMRLKRQQTQDKAIKEVGAADGVGHDAFAVDPDLHLRQLA